MRVSIHTLGTRGDVQPFVSLALALRARGHEVAITGPAQFATLVTARGIGFAALPAEFLDLLNTPAAADAIGGGKGFSAGFKLLKHVRPMMRRLFDEEWAADREFDPDVIVYHPKALAAPHIAEAVGATAILASPLPGFTATAAFPSPLLPFANLGPFNRLSHAFATGGSDMLFGRDLNRWRAEVLNAPRRRGSPRPQATLYAYSPHVLPTPPDYGPDVCVSGYWFLDDEYWAPPHELAEFLLRGDPPVYVGFGSMPGVDAAALTGAVIAGLRLAGRRAVLATGGGALSADERTADHVHFLDHAPHDRLFPLVDGVVHHGGAGTTSAALRAGKPMAIMPFFGDQPFWARRMRQLGVAPTPLDRRRLTPDDVAVALDEMAKPELARRAAAIATQLAVENGPDIASAFIESAAQRNEHPPRRFSLQANEDLRK